jgi:hypothetical protein
MFFVVIPLQVGMPSRSPVIKGTLSRVKTFSLETTGDADVGSANEGAKDV